MSEDVVVELDRWIIWLNRQRTFEAPYDKETLQRARDEIAALREQMASGEWVKAGQLDELLERIDNARAEALEEAARVCETLPGYPDTVSAARAFSDAAAAIRALKAEPPYVP